MGQKPRHPNSRLNSLHTLNPQGSAALIHQPAQKASLSLPSLSSQHPRIQIYLISNFAPPSPPPGSLRHQQRGNLHSLRQSSPRKAPGPYAIPSEQTKRTLPCDHQPRPLAPSCLSEIRLLPISLPQVPHHSHEEGEKIKPYKPKALLAYFSAEYGGEDAESCHRNQTQLPRTPHPFWRPERPAVRNGGPGFDTMTLPSRE